MSVAVLSVGMSSGSEHHPFSYGGPSQRSNFRSQPHGRHGSDGGYSPQAIHGQRPVADIGDSYLASPQQYSASPYRAEVREYHSRPARIEQQIPYTSQLQAGVGIPINDHLSYQHGQSATFGPSSFGQHNEAASSQQFSTTSSSYGGTSHDLYLHDQDSPSSYDPFEYSDDPGPSSSSNSRHLPPTAGQRPQRSRGHSISNTTGGSSTHKYPTQRKPSNRDEFDGPHQLLPLPSPNTVAAQDRDLPHLPTSLDVREQDDILTRVHSTLSKCAFDFVARYQFPIPIEPDKRPVRSPSDREWTEWVYLLKRLATKRRIPARVLYNNQIKQLVTVLENSLEMRHAAKHQSRPLKDDRNVLQLISAGIQVAKILKDAAAMEYLNQLYGRTEDHIELQRERGRRMFPPPPPLPPGMPPPPSSSMAG